jgi:purine-binding chemotaxis protein CheW
MPNRSYATFQLNEQTFGVEILQVREINRHLDLSPVPQSPDCIRGLINLRGQIVTILDLNQRVRQQPTQLGPQAHILILKTDQELVGVRERENRSDLTGLSDKVGLLVDAIGDVLTVEETEIEAPPANIGDIDGQYIAGVVNIPGQLLALLNLEKVLEN